MAGFARRIQPLNMVTIRFETAPRFIGAQESLKAARAFTLVLIGMAVAF
jgi:hypothetical protein